MKTGGIGIVFALRAVTQEKRLSLGERMLRMMNRVLNNERGTALFIALILTGLLSLVAVMAIDNSNTEMELTYNKVNLDRSFYVAEAGVKHASALIATTPGWNAGLVNVGFSDGEYSVVVNDSSANPALADSVVVVSRGEVNGAHSTVEATLVPEPFYPFRYGLYADDSVLIENSVSTDSYNSDSGSYASTVVDAYGSVGSNGTITMENNPTIAGDVMSATPGGINITGNGTVLGDTSSTAPELDFSNLIDQNDFDNARSVSMAPLGMSGSYTYNASTQNLRVSKDWVMTLQSGVYFFNNIEMDINSQIVLAPGAKVQIYMTGDLTMRNKSMVNHNGKPSSFELYSTGSKFSMEQSTEFTGAVIAPNVNFTLDNYVDFYGAMLANTIDLGNNPRFHYDRSLGRIKMGTTGRMIRVAWRELE